MRADQSSPLLFCAGAWLAQETNQDQWIQVDLQTPHRIESVTTQGRPGTQNDWVTSYYVSHSQDGTSWEEISTLFEANEDSYAKKTNRLPDNIVARYIRLRPNSWNTRIAMRFDVTGCALQGRTLVYTLNVKIMSSLLQLGYTVQQIYKSWMQKEGYIFFVITFAP